MIGRIKTGDDLGISVQQAPRVLCAHCRRHVYWLKSEAGGVAVANLAPLAGGRPATTFDCPRCGQDIRAYAPEATLKLDKGYWK
jgi:endogenous inhibitor of DNA gyrase (YacG/DUF329 family)